MVIGGKSRKMEAKNDLQYYLNLLQKFSLVTIAENKKANFRWSENQTIKLSESEFIKRYNYKGGIIKKNGEELLPTKKIGIITGYEDLECLDIDTKVFFNDPIQEGKTDQQKQKEKDEFLSELFEVFRNHIEDFDKKVVIYQTISGGFHILYKAKNISRKNLKIAKLKGFKESLLETRSIGGYVVIYPDGNYSERTYFDIDYITDEERDIIIGIAEGYDYKPEYTSPQKEIKTKIDNYDKNPSWTDYNNKTDVWDLIKDEFNIVSEDSEMKTILRRGSKANNSGYIYKDSGCLYLFSTGTIYPSEKLLSPFEVLAYQNYGGDMKETSRQLYFEGYGDRLKDETKDNTEIKKYKRNYFFSKEIFKNTLTGHQDNNFLKSLDKFNLPDKSIIKCVEDYYLGTLIKGEYFGSVTFPFIDEFGRINSIMVKRGSESVWLHSILKKIHQKSGNYPEWFKTYLKNETFNNCLFGIHLLKANQDKKIFVVESPSDAILGSLFKSEYLWLASGNKAEIQAETFRILKNKDVTYLTDEAEDLQKLESILYDVEIQEEVRIRIKRVNNIEEFLLQDSPPKRKPEVIQSSIKKDDPPPPSSPSPSKIISGIDFERIDVGLSFSEEELIELAKRILPECDSRTETEMMLALRKEEGLDVQDSKDLLMVMRLKNIIDLTTNKNYYLFNSTPF